MTSYWNIVFPIHNNCYMYNYQTYAKSGENTTSTHMYIVVCMYVCMHVYCYQMRIERGFLKVHMYVCMHKCTRIVLIHTHLFSRFFGRIGNCRSISRLCNLTLNDRNSGGYFLQVHIISSLASLPFGRFLRSRRHVNTSFNDIVLQFFCFNLHMMHQ